MSPAPVSGDLAGQVAVADPTSIEACLDEVSSTLGTPQILVNNAGIPDAQRAHKMSLKLVDAVLDTNVRGPWLVATGVAKRLIAAELPGRIVNISSISAATPARVPRSMRPPRLR